MKPKIKITLVDKMGACPCHRGHKIGDTFDYDIDRGRLCPMAMHVAFPFIDILRQGGEPPESQNDGIGFCCPDSDVVNIFKIETEEII